MVLIRMMTTMHLPLLLPQSTTHMTVSLHDKTMILTPHAYFIVSLVFDVWTFGIRKSRVRVVVKVTG